MMSEKNNTNTTITLFPLFAWLGGAFWVGNQPGNNFWDGVVWLWYVGRYIAAHFTLLTY
jgi:hypothetical protein